MKRDRREMVLAALSELGRCEVRVAGTSMWPFIRDRETVCIERGSGGIGPGTVVAFFDGSRLVVHRVAKVVPRAGTPAAFVVQGDAMPFSAAPVDADRIIGRVVSCGPGGKRRRFWFCFPGTRIALALAPVLRRLSRMRARFRGSQ